MRRRHGPLREEVYARRPVAAADARRAETAVGRRRDEHRLPHDHACGSRRFTIRPTSPWPRRVSCTFPTATEMPLPIGRRKTPRFVGQTRRGPRRVSCAPQDRRRSPRYGLRRRSRKQPAAVVLARGGFRSEWTGLGRAGADRLTTAIASGWRSWATGRECGPGHRRRRSAPGEARQRRSRRHVARPLGRPATIRRPGDFFAPHDLWLDRQVPSTSRRSSAPRGRATRRRS